jgi:hypothetical protein
MVGVCVSDRPFRQSGSPSIVHPTLTDHATDTWLTLTDHATDTWLTLTDHATDTWLTLTDHATDTWLTKRWFTWINLLKLSSFSTLRYEVYSDDFVKCAVVCGKVWGDRQKS